MASAITNKFDQEWLLWYVLRREDGWKADASSTIGVCQFKLFPDSLIWQRASLECQFFTLANAEWLKLIIHVLESAVLAPSFKQSYLFMYVYIDR